MKPLKNAAKILIVQVSHIVPGNLQNLNLLKHKILNQNIHTIENLDNNAKSLFNNAKSLLNNAKSLLNNIVTVRELKEYQEPKEALILKKNMDIS
jgi:hypothetical protein